MRGYDDMRLFGDRSGKRAVIRSRRHGARHVSRAALARGDLEVDVRERRVGREPF